MLPRRPEQKGGRHQRGGAGAQDPFTEVETAESVAMGVLEFPGGEPAFGPHGKDAPGDRLGGGSAGRTVCAVGGEAIQRSVASSPRIQTSNGTGAATVGTAARPD